MSEEKKIGLLKSSLERKSGNFEPINFYQEKKEDSQKENKVVNIQDKKIYKKPNQKATIKLPKTTKDELEAVKLLTSTKYDYEIIQTLIDNYTNGLNSSDYKKYKLLIELTSEYD